MRHGLASDMAKLCSRVGPLCHLRPKVPVYPRLFKLVPRSVVPRKTDKCAVSSPRAASIRRRGLVLAIIFTIHGPFHVCLCSCRYDSSRTAPSYSRRRSRAPPSSERRFGLDGSSNSTTPCGTRTSTPTEAGLPVSTVTASDARRKARGATSRPWTGTAFGRKCPAPPESSVPGFPREFSSHE